ncbi:MAG: type II CAAX endopeptidase family protein [Corynebacterium sp.]|uniref:CPBP family intramembrane glutamic endopeptidase n=1 Tax=Corynebacterium sp. TaxID=1720 RepID=UPI0026E093AE|nr:type II CAAX endopeptidase family protein [Corynebacterium sp.]MDO5670608.1 type II CAAX endopeptidase family protein [Corynebacterium sp.]
MTHTWNPRPVTSRDLAALLYSALALVGTAVIVALLFLALTHVLDVSAPPWLGVLMAAAGYAAQFTVLAVLLRRRGWAMSDLGFQRLGRRGWHLVWQIPTSLLITLVLTVLVAALTGLTPEDTASSDGEVLTSAVPWQLAFLLVYLLFGPLIEEIAFRRLLMGWFDRKVGVLLSTFLTSVLFGLVHVVPAIIVWCIVGGLFMALLTRWHRSLWGGFALHMVNNSLASAGLIVAMAMGT